MLPLPWVSPEVVDQILLAGRAENPNETCGVITPDSMMVRLPNRSSSPTTSFVIATEDLVNALEAYVARAGVNPEELTREHFIIWHTHPSGAIGPSRRDMEEKLPGFQYLVVSLPNGEAVRF